MELLDYIYNNFKFLEDEYNFSANKNNNSIIYKNQFCKLKFLYYSYEFSLEILIKYKEYQNVYLIDLLNFINGKSLPVIFQSCSNEVLKKLLLNVKTLLLTNTNILIGKYDNQIENYLRLNTNKFNLNSDINFRHTASELFQQGNFKEAYSAYCKIQELNKNDKKKIEYCKKHSKI